MLERKKKPVLQEVLAYDATTAPAPTDFVVQYGRS